VVENAGLTEWPVPLLGRFDADYLDVPREVIVLTDARQPEIFRLHGQGRGAGAGVRLRRQYRREGRRRGDCRGQPAGARGAARRRAILLGAGPEGAARGAGEEARRNRLSREAGHVADKVERVAKLARWLAEEGIVGDCAPAKAGAPTGPLPPQGNKKERADLAERAARLAKADLVTGMVGEFPELQG
jgi:glycyl-tRNA synthetase beta chain